VVAAATEEQIYRALGLQLIPPELREGRDEIAGARRYLARACYRRGYQGHLARAYRSLRRRRYAGDNGRGDACAGLPVFWRCRPFEVRALRGQPQRGG